MPSPSTGVLLSGAEILQKLAGYWIFSLTYAPLLSIIYFVVRTADASCDGGVAQLGERHTGSVEVMSSILTVSTIHKSLFSLENRLFSFPYPFPILPRRIAWHLPAATYHKARETGTASAVPVFDFRSDTRAKAGAGLFRRKAPLVWCLPYRELVFTAWRSARRTASGSRQPAHGSHSRRG